MNVHSAIIVSDLHCGDQSGLMPPGEFLLDMGSPVGASELQKKVWAYWEIFWHEWVPQVTKGEPFAVVINGDAIEGRHHNSTHQISQNISDQMRIALAVLAPVRNMAALDEQGRRHFYVVRGTFAHVGESAENEENLARELKAMPDGNGKHSRFELCLRLGGDNGRLVHIMHHIGTTGSMAYETTALMKEYQETCAEAGRWGNEAPAVVVRSHRHRYAETRVPVRDGYGICTVTPGWQLKTPFTYKLPGGRLITPQFGGILVRQGDEEMYTRSWVRNVERTPVEVI